MSLGGRGCICLKCTNVEEVCQGGSVGALETSAPPGKVFKSFRRSTGRLRRRSLARYICARSVRCR